MVRKLILCVVMFLTGCVQSQPAAITYKGNQQYGRDKIPATSYTINYGGGTTGNSPTVYDSAPTGQAAHDPYSNQVTQEEAAPLGSIKSQSVSVSDLPPPAATPQAAAPVDAYDQHQ